MKLAIMQPYVFPYIGYFHLIDSVDTFVFYDDVNFVNSGWVNRNKVLVNGKEFLFTIPSDWSQNKKINEVLLSDQFEIWKRKFFTTLKHSYGKEKYYKDCINILEKTFSETTNLNNLCKSSVKNVLNFLEIDKNIIDSSTIFNNQELKADARIIDICKKLKASTYINTIGGKDLYTKEDFAVESINLFFIKSTNTLNYISIIDILMKQGKQTKNFLKQYELE